MKHILIIDDDAHIREVIRFALEQAGFRIDEAKDGLEAVAKTLALKPDLLILDISMPEMDGLEACRQIRKTSHIPILFLSSRDDEIDRVVGLEIGGDDYVTKPFSPRELTARVQAILRRSTPSPIANEKALSQGNLTLSIERHIVTWNTQNVPLTATEFALLKTFLSNPTRAFNRDNLMDNAYEGAINVSDRTIDSHIKKLRSKLADVGATNIIETVRGIGYRLGDCKE